MNRSPIKLAAAALAVALVALSAFAGERAPVVLAERPGPPNRGIERLLKCLEILDLTPVQKSDIQAVLDTARPIFKADHEAAVADRDQLHKDIDAGADKCVIGQDFLNLRADAKKLYEEVESVVDQVLSKLTDDQKKKLEGCLQAPRPAAASAESESSE